MDKILKSTTDKNRYYFTYPNSYQQEPQGTSTSPNLEPHNSAPKHEKMKTKTVNHLKYRSISTSPSISTTPSSNANDDDFFPIITTTETQRNWYYSASNYIKILIIIILLTILIICAIYNNIILNYCEQFLDWMNSNPIVGSFAYILIYILCSIIMIPGSILTLGAGFVYVQIFGSIIGVILSSIVVWFGASIGSIIAFINGRYLLRNLVIYYTNKWNKFLLIDNIVGMNGFKVTFLLRLSPITPYNIFNYIMGLTSVKLYDYTIACVGMIPDSIVYCFIGGSIASITKLSNVGFASDPFLLSFTIIGSIVAIAGVLYISYIAKKEFNKMCVSNNTQINTNNNNNINVENINDNHASLVGSVNDFNHNDTLENDIDCVDSIEHDSKNMECLLV